MRIVRGRPTLRGGSGVRHLEGYAGRYGVALSSQFEFPEVVAEAGVEERTLAQGERSELLLACGERARQPATSLPATDFSILL